MAPEITLTPLIDTTLTLLVIFMITTPIMQNSLKVSLPEAKTQSEKFSTSQRYIEVFIDKDKKISVNDTQVTYENLSKQIEKELKKSTNKIVILKGDESVEYKAIIKVLDLINSIEGEKYVALATKKPTLQK